MKDTILNSVLVATAFSAILLVVIGDRGAAPEMAAAQSPQVVTVQKAPEAAPPVPADAMLVAYTGQ